MPAPWLGSQLVPSLSVTAEELTSGLASSSETNVRPVDLSVKRIGSRLVTLVNGLPVDVHVDDGVVGHESSKPTRITVLSERNIALPVSQFEPIDGSPASVPCPAASCDAAGVITLNRGAPAPVPSPAASGDADGVITLKRGGKPLPSGSAGKGTRAWSRNWKREGKSVEP